MTTINCPACAASMKRVAEPDIVIERCPECHSTWLDKDELNTLATGLAGDIEYCSFDDEIHNDEHPHRKCPKCNSVVLKKTGLLAYADIIFDSCDNCGGFFLDHGEMEKMNARLERLSGTAGGDEMREYHGSNLVVLDRIDAVAMTVSKGGIAAVPKPIIKIQVSIYFDSPLRLGLRVSSEKWTAKLAKVFGLFDGEDIIVGDSEIDSRFLVEGDNPEEITALLTKPAIKQALVNFVDSKPQIFTETGELEIVDKRLIYSEGPYLSQDNLNLKESSQPLVNGLLTLAQEIEANA